MGEDEIIGAPAAIANALADALALFGAEIFELPMTRSAYFGWSRASGACRSRKK